MPGATPPERAAAAPRLADWIGRTESVTETVSPASVRAIRGALDLVPVEVAAGEPLPPLHHWLYGVAVVPTRALGPDGHPARGGFLPPVALPRRMWAGTRGRWHAPIRVGDTLERRSRVADVRERQGRSGALVFVTVDHEWWCGAGLAVEETQEIVYRELPAAGARASDPARAPEPAPPRERFPHVRAFRAGAVDLFRYSAVHRLAHRVHYDRRWAVEVEGYPDLLVHGPLVATRLAALAWDCGADRAPFPLDYEIRARAPLYVDTDAELRAGAVEDDGTLLAIAVGPDGATTMELRLKAQAGALS